MMHTHSSSEGDSVIAFNFYRGGMQIDGSIRGGCLPHEPHFVVNFCDAESVFVTAVPRQPEGYDFVWSIKEHKYSDLTDVFNRLIELNFAADAALDKGQI